MIYLTRMLGRPVVDAAGVNIGSIHDVAIATGEIFPRVTSLAFLGPDKTPFMLSWRKYVTEVEADRVVLNVPRADIRFSYLQPQEVLLHRDLLNKQIVDTQGMKVVRVNDLKLSESRNQLRLLGAEVGVRGILRGLSPSVERATDAVLGAFGRALPETIIAWNYMDLLDRDLSHVRLSVTHKRLHELHPADVADVLEQLSPSQRARVFEHLDNAQAAEAISELEDDLQADVIDDLGDQRASDILEMMDPDDAADVIGDLPYDKAETLLRLMGVGEARQVRKLLGYKEKTAGGIMTPEVTTVTEGMTVEQVIDHLRGAAAEHESIYYVYTLDADGRLSGVLSLRDLLVSAPDTLVEELVVRDLFTADPEQDQEEVAETMSKYDLLALPVVDEGGRILGIVTVDDALDVLEEESAEDLALATGSAGGLDAAGGLLPWLARRMRWIVLWALLLLAGAGAARAYLGEAAPVALIALFFVPLVLRLSEDVSGHSLALLIEEPGETERPSFGRRALADVLGGLALGAAGGALAFAVLELVGAGLSLATATAAGILAAGPSMTLLGSAVASAARRATGDRPASATLLSFCVGAAGTAVFAAVALTLMTLLPA